MTASWMSLAWFALIVALIPAALWMMKRSGLAGGVIVGGKGRAAALGLRQVGALSLGPQQRIVAVEVGQGASRRCLLLGVTAQRVNTLHVMDDDWLHGAETVPVDVHGGRPLSEGFGAELARRLRSVAGTTGQGASHGR
jgi:flagellar protein FliO/FliZ